MNTKRKLLSLILLMSSLLIACNNNPSPSFSESDPVVESTSDSVSESVTESESIEESESVKESESEIESETESESQVPTSIEAPNITISENVVSWQDVNNAEIYEYSINGRTPVLTSENYVALNDGENVSVRSINQTHSLYSDFSKAVTYFESLNFDYEYKKVIVYFHNSDISPMQIQAGEAIGTGPIANKTHYDFVNWYKDPYFEEIFDFSKPIYEDTIVYAKWNPKSYRNATYWVKCNDLVLSEDKYEMGVGKFDYIPMKLMENSNPKIFTSLVTIENSSASSPAYFLITDGLDGTGQRNYWKINNQDFAITQNGTYLITFSTETEYQVDGYITNAKYELVTTPNYAPNYAANDVVTVSVMEEGNYATWNVIPSAVGYEYVIDNGEIQYVKSNSNRIVDLYDGQHISVRARYEVGHSMWSTPAANHIYKEAEINPYTYAYFIGSDTSSIKVLKGESITLEGINIESKDGYNFVGWYLDIALTKKASFPYILNENTSFYPKFDGVADNTKVHYYLKNSNHETVATFTWNLEKYTYDEYESSVVNLTAEAQYYITNLDGSKKWENVYVHTNNSYRIYFSEDYLWGVGTDKVRHFYISCLSIDLYFSAPQDWMNVNYYAWGDSGFKKAWPGEAAEYVKTNSYGQKQYKVNLNVEIYNNIIFNNGQGKQTCDIPLDGVGNNTGFYIDGSGYGTFYFE